MYMTVVLAAGISPYFYVRPKFILFWTVLFHGDHALKPSLGGLFKATIVYWVVYMSAFLALRFIWQLHSARQVL